jgi:hypothetical protein
MRENVATMLVELEGSLVVRVKTSPDGSTWKTVGPANLSIFSTFGGETEYGVAKNSRINMPVLVNSTGALNPVHGVGSSFTVMDWHAQCPTIGLSIFGLPDLIRE